MVPADLKKAFSKGDFSPVYYFYGANTLLIDKAVEGVISAFFPSKETGLGLEHFDGQVHDPSEIINSLRTLPFGAEKKLVIVKSADAFKAAQAGKFTSYFSSPSKRSCLVFAAQKMAFKGKLLTALKKTGRVVSFENPKKEGDIKKFISDAFRSRGKSISSDALKFMADNTGKDMGVINNEVEKIVLFCGDKKTVDRQALEAVLTTGNRDTIFDLVEEIGKGNVQRSILLLGSLLNAGNHPLVILKMVSRQFRLIGIAMEGLDKGFSRGEIGKKLGFSYDFIINKLVEQARGWNSQSLGKVFEAIFETDYLLKSSRVDGNVIMEELIFRLIKFRNQAPA